MQVVANQRLATNHMCHPVLRTRGVVRFTRDVISTRVSEWWSKSISSSDKRERESPDITTKPEGKSFKTSGASSSEQLQPQNKAPLPRICLMTAALTKKLLQCKQWPLVELLRLARRLSYKSWACTGVQLILRGANLPESDNPMKATAWENGFVPEGRGRMMSSLLSVESTTSCIHGV